ncbi:uncharacterized protein B0H64DRAFT_314110 [Chaetomium fimeti]|uniref:Uncharacterized protein n=1 Tax=Chaetomium fimeti TaxID=1854472 RepID=A0AAE0LX31_9PEZI|nr:hypothetical protein B0H64DRAFT_314110 [Chaetomium fimeti]
METVFCPPHFTDPNNPGSLTWLYWMDPSCDNASNGGVEAHLSEARHWAKRAYERLTSRTDTDFARVFNIIFKVPVADPVRYPTGPWSQSIRGPQLPDEWRTSAEHVLGVLYHFAHCWERTNERKKADVRIYATDLAQSRWLPIGTTDAFDPVNQLVYDETPASLHGDDEHDMASAVCDLRPGLWTPATGKFLTLRGLNPTLLLAQHNPPRRPTTGSGDPIVRNLVVDLMACTIFHEFMHVYLLDDFAEDSGRSAGWGHCMLQKRGEAAVCAESLAVLGLFAALADMTPGGRPSGGFSLNRQWRGTSGGLYDADGSVEVPDETESDPDEKCVNSAVRGELIFYEDLTS